MAFTITLSPRVVFAAVIGYALGMIKKGAWCLAVTALAAAAYAQESVTLTTTYPAPSGTYNQIVTTGGGNRDTVLNRDGGNTVLTGSGNAAGRVGIGVSAPATKLDVAGDARLTGGLSAGGSVTAAGAIKAGGPMSVGMLAADPPGSNGMIYYNTTTNSFKGFSNGAWKELAVSACKPDGSCSAAVPACGKTTTGVDNCGTPCAKTGPLCVYNCGSCTVTFYAAEKLPKNVCQNSKTNQTITGSGVCTTPTSTLSTTYKKCDGKTYTATCTATNTPLY